MTPLPRPGPVVLVLLLSGGLLARGALCGWLLLCVCLEEEVQEVQPCVWLHVTCKSGNCKARLPPLHTLYNSVHSISWLPNYASTRALAGRLRQSSASAKAAPCCTVVTQSHQITCFAARDHVGRHRRKWPAPSGVHPAVHDDVIAWPLIPGDSFAHMLRGPRRRLRQLPLLAHAFTPASRLAPTVASAWLRACDCCLLRGGGGGGGRASLWTEAPDAVLARKSKNFYDPTVEKVSA